jgi:hypothetical protein
MGDIASMEGGCQCGAIRYAVDASLGEQESPGPEGFAGAHYCHCRMCQRALGNLFGLWLPVHKDRLRWLREQPKYYRSSHFLERGFCGACGTPLGARYVQGLKDWPYVDIAGILVGTLDHPELVRPVFHFGIESQVPWLRIDDDLPRRRTDDLTGFRELRERASAPLPRGNGG